MPYKLPANSYISYHKLRAFLFSDKGRLPLSKIKMSEIFQHLSEIYVSEIFGLKSKCPKFVVINVDCI